MSEIDKLINQAFPDELRDIEPIDVDEDAILQLTLQQLGLKPSQKLELPQLSPTPVKSAKRSGEGQQEPELAEAPAAARHRWIEWAGWAIAACLVLAFAVKWGPWLIENLGFGLAPRSSGDVVQSEDRGLENSGYNTVISRFMVDYGYDTVTFTVYFDTAVEDSPDIDLDKLDIRVENEDSETVTRVRRSNLDQSVILIYELNGAQRLEMTVSQLVPIEGGESGEAGFIYRDIEKLNINLDEGVAYSGLFPEKQYRFSPMDASSKSRK